jgi:hypothetical protein
MILTLENSTASGSIGLRFRSGGTDKTTTNYYQAGQLVRVNNTTTFYTSNGADSAFLFDIVGTAQWGHAVMEIIRPNEGGALTWSSNAYGYTVAQAHFSLSGILDTAYSADGFTLRTTAGNITGTIQVFGYND